MNGIGPNYDSKMLDDYYRQSLVSNLEPDEKSEEMDPSEGLARRYTPRPVDVSKKDANKHIHFSEDVEVFEFNTQIEGSQENFDVADLSNGVKEKPRRLKSEEKTTQHQDHCKKEKEDIQEFLKKGISISQRDTPKARAVLEKITGSLEDYLNEVERHKALKSNQRQVYNQAWHQFQTEMNRYLETPGFQELINLLFGQPEGKELLHALLDKKNAYHTSSREEFKLQFHNYV